MGHDGGVLYGELDGYFGNDLLQSRIRNSAVE